MAHQVLGYSYMLPMPTLTRSPPVIDTARLRLRPHEVGDLEACVAMWSDASVTRYTSGSASSMQRTWQRVLAYRGHWVMLGYGYWAVEERSSGEYVGELGFADFKRGFAPCIAGIPELGWALVPSARGKGFAIEALRAAVEWGDERFSHARTACIIHHANSRSFRLAEKLGYLELRRVTVDGMTQVVLTRDPQIVMRHPVHS